MKVIKLGEYGYEWALLGISLSRDQDLESMPRVANNLADKDGGHNKFLEFISVWLDITAPRFFWQEMSTYRVGNSWQSESTMYTITKKELDIPNFEYPISLGFISSLNSMIYEYKTIADRNRKKAIFLSIKNSLPEGFLQRRVMITNYKSLRNIISQRRNHKLPQWGYFCDIVMSQLEHPEFIDREYRKDTEC